MDLTSSKSSTRHFNTLMTGIRQIKKVQKCHEAPVHLNSKILSNPIKRDLKIYERPT